MKKTVLLLIVVMFLLMVIGSDEFDCKRLRSRDYGTEQGQKPEVKE